MGGGIHRSSGPDLRRRRRWGRRRLRHRHLRYRRLRRLKFRRHRKRLQRPPRVHRRIRATPAIPLRRAIPLTEPPPTEPSYGTPSYVAAPYWQQGAPPPSTNGFAIASLVCSCAGPFFLGIGCILGIVFGFVARSQIRQSNGSQTGGGLALAGIIVGFSLIALFVLIVVLIVVFANNVTDCNSSFNSCSVN